MSYQNVKKSISKNVYINKWDDIVNEYNNANDRTTKMHFFGVKSRTYINFNVKNSDFCIVDVCNRRH